MRGKIRLQINLCNLLYFQPGSGRSAEKYLAPVSGQMFRVIRCGRSPGVPCYGRVDKGTQCAKKTTIHDSVSLSYSSTEIGEAGSVWRDRIAVKLRRNIITQRGKKAAPVAP